MPTVTTRSTDPTAAAEASVPVAAPGATMQLALDLGNSRWQLAFATTVALAPRLRTVAARDLAALAAEIVAATTRFGLPAAAPVVSCYEADRDGFWLHRALAARGLHQTALPRGQLTGEHTDRRDADNLDLPPSVRVEVRRMMGAAMSAATTR